MRSIPPRLAAAPRCCLLAAAAALLAIAAAGCASGGSVEKSPDELLFERGVENLKGQRTLLVFKTPDYEGAITAFEDLITNYPLSDRAIEAELKLSDAYFLSGRHEEAISGYTDFLELHPGNENVPYVLYMVGLCHHRQIGNPDRDQTHTVDAIKYFDMLRERYPNSPYLPESAEKRAECLRVLAMRDFNVADYYFKKKNYSAALQRCVDASRKYVGEGVEDRALLCIGRCYFHLNEPGKAARALETLTDKYPESSHAEDARELLKKLASGKKPS